MYLVKELRFRLGSLRHAHRLHQELMQTRKENRRLGRQNAKHEAVLARAREGRRTIRVGTRTIEPWRLIWIFGTARVGSTWLLRMMGESHPTWNEPLVGAFFGRFLDENTDHQRRGDDFILGGGYDKRALRQFILWSAGQRFPEAERVVVKEPNGSIGAPHISRSLPESGLICLVRDPRDVVASGLGAARSDGWQTRVRERRGLPPESPDDVVRSRAERYLRLMGASVAAYEAHEGPKAMLRYEALRHDTLQNMKQLYSDLNIEIDQEALKRTVEKHTWENVPEEKKGPGRSLRKATPGGWQDDLTEEQVRVVERITSSLMDELGYAKAF